MVRAGEERRPRAKDGDEASPENHLAAVAAEEPDPDLEPLFVQVDLVAVPQQQLRAAVAADRVADVVPDDRCGRRDRNDRPDLELVRRAGIERSPDERGLAGHGHADALEHHEQEHDDVAVGLEPRVDRVGGDDEAERHSYILTCNSPSGATFKE